ncbi:MAG: AMP-binding protein [Ignavibacteriales bacterium]|nr:AMP-binding protein [Ignavibacteriales bacterium]
MNCSELLTSRARLSPSAIAVTDHTKNASYTYGDLETRSIRTAACLSGRHHVRQDDRVCLLAHNGIVSVDLLFGSARIGAILTPLNWRLTPAELRPLVADASPVLLIFGQECMDLAVQSVDGLHVPIASVEEWSCAMEQVDAPARAPLDLPEEHPLAILYTSGTTGIPKGAVISHRQVLWNCINTVISWGLAASDAAPILTPMFHAGGLFVFLTPLLYVGGRVILTAGLNPEESLALIEQQQCTVILGVPTLFQIWLQSPVVSNTNFAAVRWFISGGAPCSPALIRQWRERTGTIIRQGYGLTEAGVNCFSMTDEESISHAGSVGKPIFHSSMKIVDTNGKTVPPGETGELCIAGPHVFAGYWNRREATDEVLRDGWLHTGDMARCDGEGYFSIVGRYKDMIISGGENIYAAEVEAVFKEHPAVSDAALIGEPDVKWGEAGVMVVVRKSGGSLSSGELFDFCNGKLARYKIPKRILFAASLPTSPYGKVMKNVLKEIVLKGEVTL